LNQIAIGSTESKNQLKSLGKIFRKFSPALTVLDEPMYNAVAGILSVGTCLVDFINFFDIIEQESPVDLVQILIKLL